MQESDKARLDRLQARLTGRLGRRISQEVLLARLVALGEAEIDRLSDSNDEAKPNLARLLDLPVKTGLATREEDIDATLYGSEA